ncbi:hypothetical protein [Ancylobacter defluvii]|uniref:Uncharacterized protein n=1 Tax=Ancylobacter defluvii TaxID=1282440 RepID=A0A9W6K1C0_9HYPH|nr:hypothetical protein [Ancylobacter defluvii]MBS7586403.1 hypothetical protein [Ancylobacter defluvii]GLK85684.1 hypothetical protein GCM10017653_37540 [Ancylobacter defluvii]
MILGGLAALSGFSAEEIESFDFERARFWWNCIMAYRKHEADLIKDN